MIKLIKLNLNLKKSFAQFLILITQNYQLVLILAIIFYIIIAGKWSWGMIQITTEFAVAVFLLTLGQTFIMLVGEIDLALPNTMVLSSVLYVKLSKAIFPFISLIIVTIFILAITWMYGWIVSKLSLNSLAFSLGMLFCIQYMIHFLFRYDTIRENRAIQLIKPVQTLSIMLLLTGIAGLLAFLLLRSKWGIWIRAVGSRSALFESIIGKRIPVVSLAYASAGFLAVIASIISTAKYKGAQTTPYENILFYSIGAAILGGVRLAGGRGNVWMALQGSILVALIVKYLDIINIHSDLRLVLFGLLILLVSLYSETIRRKIRDVCSII